MRQKGKTSTATEVIDAADDLPNNGTLPSSESLTDRLDQVMKKINTICLKDYSNLMEYRKSLSMKDKGDGSNSLSSPEPRPEMREESAFVNFFNENVTKHVLDLFDVGESEETTTTIHGMITLPNENTKSSSSSKTFPPTISGFGGQVSFDPVKFSSQSTSKPKKSINQNNINKTRSNDNNDISNVNVNKCLEALIEFAELTKDFRIWYNDKLRRASSMILNSLNLAFK